MTSSIFLKSGKWVNTVRSAKLKEYWDIQRYLRESLRYRIEIMKKHWFMWLNMFNVMRKIRLARDFIRDRLRGSG